jgi:hypothetical protein
MQIVTQSLKHARQQKALSQEVVSWYKRAVHRRHRRAMKVWLRTGQLVRNIERPLTGRYLN